MKQSTHAEEERLLKFAKGYLSEAFPNPGRTGCPDETALRSLAVQPHGADAAVSEHLAFCSPCFNRYMDLLAQGEEKRETRFNKAFTWVIALPLRAAGVVALALGLGIGMYVLVGRFEAPTPIPPTPSEVTAPSEPTWAKPGTPTYAQFMLDMSGLSPTRGSKSRTPGSQRRIRVPGSLLELTLTLPLGSEEQSYRITLRSGGHIFLSKSTQAHLHNGHIVIRTEADFRQVPAGSYDLEVESSEGIRLTQPVLIETAPPKSTGQE